MPPTSTAASTMRAFAARRQAEHDAATAARVAAARAALPALVALLRDKHGATRVWLLGSLAWGEPHADSDVDIAVTDVADLIAAEVACAEVAPCPIQLLPFERLDIGFQKRITDEGEVLLGR